MTQEYLFIDATHRSAVESYTPDKVKVEIYDIENSSCWIAIYSQSGENEETAKTLSRVNDYVLSHFSPTVLSNGSSAYYNKRLYPCINEFERKLRKLLYLKSALYQGDKKLDNIRDLEEKDLGKIFELLFTDAEFVKHTKSKLNEKTWQFTKQEILAALQSIAEDTLWDSLIGADSVKALSNGFITVKNYRNDVMHAHNIDTKTYQEAKRLFEKINEQLDLEIGKIIKTVEEQPEEAAKPEFNEALNHALQTQNIMNALQHISNAAQLSAGNEHDMMQKIARQISESYASSIAHQQLLDSIKLKLNLSSDPEYLQLRESLRQIASYQLSPELAALRKQLREYSALAADLKKMKETISAIPIHPLTNTEETSITHKEDATEEEDDA